MISSHSIRKKYLEFFQKQRHVIVPSASLLPENDPTTLFTGSGMQPMIAYLLGQKHPDGTRLTDSQKCFRSIDIEEVGDNRHTTFFEMLGNWSLGDYFKKEQIAWIFQFLVHELKLTPERLYVSVFRGNDEIGVERDTESVQYWQEMFASVGITAKDVDFSESSGMQGGRIFYYDETKNWWSRVGIPHNMPAGEPGGPDSEIFWDFGVENGMHEKSVWNDKPCHVNCDCGRFMEIGNNVFMAYMKTEQGFKPLAQKNVDFGGGLERLAAAVNDDSDMFQIDIFSEAMKKIEAMSQKPYTESDETKRSYRVILDHLRAATFLVGDGAYPSNKDQGYFTRRLIRRAIRYAQNLGIKENFCGEVVRGYLVDYAQAYPYLQEREREIVEQMTREEEKFRKTLVSGLKMFEQLVSLGKTKDEHDAPLVSKILQTPQSVIPSISAHDAFDLYQTYGFPLEITEELARERGLKVDVHGFKRALSKHQELSRAGATQKFSGGLADHSETTVRGHTATHLLHQALRTILGPHVLQKGSNITPQRIRFDFSHHTKMTTEQIQSVEDLVNEQVKRELPVSWEILPLEKAMKQGAIGVFEEKYGENVKVYSVGDFSKEFCGGPHVSNTRDVGKFKIIKEEAVSAGIRRIKAILE